MWNFSAAVRTDGAGRVQRRNARRRPPCAELAEVGAASVARAEVGDHRHEEGAWVPWRRLPPSKAHPL